MIAWWVAAAWAGGESADIELLHPTFSTGSTPLVESARTGRTGTVRAALLYQYEADPLVLYRQGEEVGAAVANRAMVHVGASLDFSRRFSAHLVLPMSFDWASEVPRLDTQGFGVGDLYAGVRYVALDLPALQLGPHVTLWAPTGQQDAWRGEVSPRAAPGLLAQVNLGPLSLLTDTAVLFRGATDTGYDLHFGHELTENAALRVSAWDERVVAYGGVAWRWGLTDLGFGEYVGEAVSGLQVRALREWTADLGVGRGLTDGYGTTNFRGILGVSWSRVPPPPKRPQTVVIEEVPETVPDEVILNPVEPPPPPPPVRLAEVKGDEIVIRDPIQFEFAKDVILPVSFPVLQAVAEILRDHPEILQLVIEGHASEEGSFAYNYDLANRRANAIFRALIERGVHPDRLSYRSMGEVKPTTEATDEASLAVNRRVVFSITRRLLVGEALPPYTTEIRLPWTGDTVQIPPPGPLPPEYTATPEPARPPPPKDAPYDPKRIKEDEEDEE